MCPPRIAKSIGDKSEPLGPADTMLDRDPEAAEAAVVFLLLGDQSDARRATYFVKQSTSDKTSVHALTPIATRFETHLTVSNLDRSIAFYRDVVGLPLAHRVPDGMRSREGQAMMREVRFAGWLLRKPGRFLAMPDEMLAARFPPPPWGWRGYRALRSRGMTQGGATNGEWGGICGGDR